MVAPQMAATQMVAPPDSCFLDGQLADFKQVKIDGYIVNFKQVKIGGYFVNFEQVKIDDYFLTLSKSRFQMDISNGRLNT